MIMVDNKYFAHALHRARRDMHLSQLEVSKILKIPRQDLHKYESGKEIIPYDLLRRLLRAGMFVFRK